MNAVYDDADLAAVELVRRALHEWEAGALRSDDRLDEVLADTWRRHGCAGVTALVFSLARHGAAAVSLLGDARGENPHTLLDECELAELVSIAGAGS